MVPIYECQRDDLEVRKAPSYQAKLGGKLGSIQDKCLPAVQGYLVTPALLFRRFGSGYRLMGWQSARHSFALASERSAPGREHRICRLLSR